MNPQVQKSAAGGLGLGFGVGEELPGTEVGRCRLNVWGVRVEDEEEDKYSKVKELVNEDLSRTSSPAPTIAKHAAVCSTACFRR